MNHKKEPTLWKAELRAYQPEGIAQANIPKACTARGQRVPGSGMNSRAVKAGGSQLRKSLIILTQSSILCTMKSHWGLNCKQERSVCFLLCLGLISLATHAESCPLRAQCDQRLMDVFLPLYFGRPGWKHGPEGKSIGKGKNSLKINHRHNHPHDPV